MQKKNLFIALVLVIIGGVVLFQNNKAPSYDARPQIVSYSELVYKNYKQAFDAAKVMQNAINTFLANPNEATMKAAKEAWLVARNPYSETEAFRFYEGPIDFVNEEQGTEGPEGRLNAWPLNEAYIDYVRGNAASGIVQDASKPLTVSSIKGLNQASDEADVSTGYHAIEFLLWGQDLSLSGPGNRPASDYLAGNLVNERRRVYLKTVTDVLVDDLAFLVKSWAPTEHSYAVVFSAMPQKEALAKILTSLATLSGFELASERMATALDSGDQEDEHSCFSDNTHNDFIYNAKGIKNVYFAKYDDYKGASLHELLMTIDSSLAGKIAMQLDQTEKTIAALPAPIDREVLATAPSSEPRQKMEKAIASLQAQAKLFVQAGKALGVDAQLLMD